MTALCSFTFQGLKMRPVRYCANSHNYSSACQDCLDLRLARAWTAADPHHRGTDARFWLEQDQGIESYLMEERGCPLFFFKLVRWPGREIEVHIQFSPDPADASRQDHRRSVMRALSLGLEWLERVLAPTGVSELFFLSRSPSLIRFSTRHLGFIRNGDRLSKRIPKSPPVSA